MQNFPVALVLMLYKVILPLASVDEINKCVAFDINLTKLYFSVIATNLLLSSWKQKIYCQG